jgi:hypothetical protein
MQKNLMQQLTEELTAQNARAKALQQIVDELFTIAALGAVKNALWMRYQGIEGASPSPGEVVTEQALAVAQQQAARDMPYVEVGVARRYQYHEASQRWYVEVDLSHNDPEEGAAIALYRVWRTPDGFSAIKVDIRESDE